MVRLLLAAVVIASQSPAPSPSPTPRPGPVVRVRMGLGNLADRTGGFMISHSNDLARAIHRVVEDQQGYYLIGYVPPASALEGDARRLRFHRLQVSVRRPGLRVQRPRQEGKERGHPVDRPGSGVRVIG